MFHGVKPGWKPVPMGNFFTWASRKAKNWGCFLLVQIQLILPYSMPYKTYKMWMGLRCTGGSYFELLSSFSTDYLFLLATTVTDANCSLKQLSSSFRVCLLQHFSTFYRYTSLSNLIRVSYNCYKSCIIKS